LVVKDALHLRAAYSIIHPFPLRDLIFSRNFAYVRAAGKAVGEEKYSGTELGMRELQGRR
jgi:hypothetical protein